MASRKYINLEMIDRIAAERYLDLLSSESTSVEDYRNCFYQLGRMLGDVAERLYPSNGKSIMIACASEDADWLARGVIETTTSAHLSLAVFWNERVKRSLDFDAEYSPIVKSYIEPTEDCENLIIVKSIISTSCVVKTQLLRLIDEITPKNIIIISPVMYKDAESNLRAEFPKGISDKFKFITFAIDSERDLQGVIHPGIGGMVYPRLGLGDIHQKNKYMPRLVKDRIAI